MEKKGSEKNRHVVPWLNKAEWEQVRDYLYSMDSSLRGFALDRISAWRIRCADSFPMAVDCTAYLVRCQMQDLSGQLTREDLILMYGMAVVSFVSLITERQQGRRARPMKELAANLNVPKWMVDLRHKITHRKIPSLKWCQRGCKVALEWLQQEYWSRQLGGAPDERCDLQSHGEDELVARQKEVDACRKPQELVISYEKHQYQAFQDKEKSLWQAPLADMSWLLGEIKQFALESSEVLVDVLLKDGFLVPTMEQLEAIGCATSDSASPTEPRVPQTFLRFWLPLLKMLNSPSFIHLFLEKLFVELKLLSKEPDRDRCFYISAWISEVLLCNNKFEYETKLQKKARTQDRIFINRIQLRWQQLLSDCLDAPCISTPHLIQLILDDMGHLPPQETREKLVQPCSIYTQTECSEASTPLQQKQQQPIYTVEVPLDEMQHSQQDARPLHSSPMDSETSEERKWADVQAERALALRGSPWQVCTDNVSWKNYAIGKVPGQSDDPSCLMVDNYTIMTVSDQPVELESSATRSSIPGASAPARPAEGHR
ncbi:ribosomal biogenesis protein LAS1L-like [Oreochromis aureus]|uniref:ribosomal biogenesis protein LAS1L-like n=1 Tax=Oreochromis aureus TaxID=47969 RepID=UPI001953A78E|nr:ribosomal biogenesis protein LAS1L-like [Oreochromis aureus]